MDLFTDITLFEGISFWIAFIIVALPAIVILFLGKRIKFYTLTISLLFIVSVYHGNALYQLFTFILYQLTLIYGYRLLSKKYSEKNKTYFYLGCIVIFLSLLPIVISRLHQRELVALPVGFLGISYITFRTIQILLDIYDKKEQHYSIPDIFLFILFFPTISSGPIDRSERFRKDITHQYLPKEYANILSQGIINIFLGLAYKQILGQFFYTHMNEYTHSNLPTVLIPYMYLYGFYLFFDFAGYSLMAVGTAQTFGVNVPHNFRYPFIAKDFKDFWERWHISLSMWFRDYLFSRYVMWCIRKKIFRNRLYTAASGYMITMLSMGAWHGLSFSYLCYGCYHGLMLSLTEIYQKKSKFHKKYRKNKIYTACSIAVTFQLTMLGFLIFSGRFSEVLLSVWRHL